MEELKEALDSKDSDSTPGEDEIPYTFYKTFWEELKYLMLASSANA